MNVYLKIHIQGDYETVACCDEELLDKELKEGNLKIQITDHFFGGSLMEMEEAIEILKDASYFNIIGKSIIGEAIASKILSEEGVRSISGVPMALKMMF